MFTQPFHDFQYHNACLSEGKALAIVVEDFFQTPHLARDNKDFPRLMRKSDARLRLACPLLARRGGAPHERGAGGGSDPGILTAGAAPGRVSRFTSQFRVNPPLGVAPSTVILREGFKVGQEADSKNTRPQMAKRERGLEDAHNPTNSIYGNRVRPHSPLKTPGGGVPIRGETGCGRSDRT